MWTDSLAKDDSVSSNHPSPLPKTHLQSFMNSSFQRYSPDAKYSEIDSQNLRDSNNHQEKPIFRWLMELTLLPKTIQSLWITSTFSLWWIAPSKDILLMRNIVKSTRGIYAIQTVPKEVYLDKMIDGTDSLGKDEPLWIILPPSVFHEFFLPKIFSCCKI